MLGLVCGFHRTTIGNESTCVHALKNQHKTSYQKLLSCIKNQKTVRTYGSLAGSGRFWSELRTYRKVWRGVCPTGKSSWREIGTSHGGRKVIFPNCCKAWMVSAMGSSTTMGHELLRKWVGREMGSTDRKTVSYLAEDHHGCRSVGLHSWRLLLMGEVQNHRPSNRQN